MTTQVDDESLSATAGEYVLGTLSVSERLAFEQQMQRHPALQAEVYFWQDHLLYLARGVQPVQPKAEVWPSIETALAPRVATLAPVTPVPPVTPLGPQPSDAANDSLWRRLKRWQWVAGVAMAASLVLATVLGMKTLLPPAAMPERYLAVLQAPDDRSTGWIVEVTRGDRVRLIPVGAPQSVPVGKSLQFWTKAKDAAGPTSMGLVTAGRTNEYAFTALPSAGVEQLFEVTLEPEGGSTIGRPTGPILFVGRTVRL